MGEELGQIDISTIAELVRIKEQEEVLRQRLAKMEASKEKVSQVVYRRVREDYESRQASLDAEARPLKERARREYAKLRVLRGEAERAVDDASLQKEELEFRRDLGEFPDTQFKERLAECEKRLADRKRELDQVIQLKERFLEAFHSEEELNLPEAAAAPRLGMPAPAASAPAPEFSPDATVLASGSPGQPTPAEPSPDATVLSSGAPRVVAPPAAPPTAPAAEAATSTMLVPMPRIVMLVDNGPAEEFVLRPGITSIGRSPKAEIQLSQFAVSRRHANVVFTNEGYRIIDLGSDNGTYVNGERIKERLLADGDIIQVGTQRLMFKS